MHYFFALFVLYTFADSRTPESYCQEGHQYGYPNFFSHHFYLGNKVYHLDGTLKFETPNLISDVQSSQDLLILTQGEVIDLSTSKKIEFSSRPHRFTKFEDTLFLADGSKIYSFVINDGSETLLFDVKTLFGSTVVDIKQSNGIIFVLLTSVRQTGANGLMTFDAKTLRQINLASYDSWRSGVIDPDSFLSFWRDEVILNNGGWIHRLKKDIVLKKRRVHPFWQSIPMGEGRDRFFMMLKGRPTVMEDKIVGCGSYSKKMIDHVESYSDFFSISLEIIK